MGLAVGPDDFHLCDGVISRYDNVYIVYNNDWILGVSLEGLILTESNTNKNLDIDISNRIKVVGIDII